MDTDDIRISINESDNSKTCTRSSNKTGLQIFVPSSNFNTHTKVEVIEGELGNNIRKLRTKSLEEDPDQLGQISLYSNNWSFYKVPYPLRQVNETAYEPYVISIGPYHHGNKRLETMEVIKRNCFSKMIKKKKIEPGKFVTVMKKLEKQVHKLYEEVFDRFDPDTFVEMMILDGCFIILLFEKNDYLYTLLRKLKKGILTEIRCDLLLLENQLPFFVLFKLYNVIMSNVEIDEFSRWVISCFSKYLPIVDICLPEKFSKPKNIKHLLGLVHHSWFLSARKPEIETKAQSLWKFICCGTEREEKGKGRKGKRSRNFIRCATELEEAGINFINKDYIDKNNKFTLSNIKSWICHWLLQDKDRKDKTRKEEKGKASLFDIDFTDDGKLKIPTLSVGDNTERILRNFIAYEQFRNSLTPNYVCDYVTLMDNLINSGKDVQLLCNSGIIDNWLGDDEVVAQMFNKLRDFIYSSMDSNDFYYAEIFDKVNEHCKRSRNKWKAKLNKDYFNSPWAIISVLAAFVLLLLTLLQTIFSVLSYVHPK